MNINLDVAAVVTALFAGIGVLIGATWAGKRAKADAHKTEAEAAKLEAEAQGTSINTANEFIRTLRDEIAQLRGRVEGLERDVRQERLMSNEINIKYHHALDRIVELETETRTLRAQLAEAQLEIEKHRQQLDGAIAGKTNGTE
jgi:chromosome segregation ATPase